MIRFFLYPLLASLLISPVTPSYSSRRTPGSFCSTNLKRKLVMTIYEKKLALYRSRPHKSEPSRRRMSWPKKPREWDRSIERFMQENLVPQTNAYKMVLLREIW